MLNCHKCMQHCPYEAHRGNGAWEIPTGPDVAILIPHVGFTTVRWATAFATMQRPANTLISCTQGYSIADVRNNLVKHALERNARWIFFLDSDIIVRRDTLMRLLSHNLDFVCGLYYRKAEPIGPAMWLDRPCRMITSYEPGKLVEVHLVGMGCALIHSRVFREMEPPWFKWTLDDDSIDKENQVSEDFYFCRRFREELGGKIFVDTGCQVEHAGWSTVSSKGIQPF